jgi:ABC-type lipoprotein export system ATPase subunit
MELDRIVITGARQHNLKNVTVEIPKKKLVVLTGVSGSGKSSLAFDTLGPSLPDRGRALKLGATERRRRLSGCRRSARAARAAFLAAAFLGTAFLAFRRAAGFPVFFFAFLVAMVAPVNYS